MNNQIHYDNVTDAWMLILGDNLHYGYFESGTETLSEATNALIDAMAALGPAMSPDTKLLDVGCGVGHPAFHLSQHTGCQIEAISNSARGIERAEEACRRRGLQTRIHFHHRDALDNGFPDASFDVVWVMESSHLMRDKARLCAESWRVLRPGGTMLLCDLVLSRNLSVMELYRLRDDIAVLDRAFGSAKMETLGFYESTLRGQGFEEVVVRDVSPEVAPTLGRWMERLEAHREELAVHLSRLEIDDFAHSCRILEDFFARGLLGYGIVKGVRPDRSR